METEYQNALERIKVLEQLLFATASLEWLKQEGNKPSVTEFFQFTVEAALSCCYDSGAFVNCDEAVIQQVYSQLTGRQPEQNIL